MKKWLKRIRGALGMGLTWAAAWGGVFGIASMIGGAGGGLANLGANLVTFGLLGFIGGAAFSVVLGIAEGRRRFDEMSLWRFAFWGALGGGLLMTPPLLMGWVPTLEGWGIAGVLALLGAGCSAGSLALARRADDRELLEHGADVADIGLTEEEKRKLLAG